MRCLACDVALTDFESTRRFNKSGEFVDLCNHCFRSGVDEMVQFSERQDLQEAEDMDIMEK
jgi:hypothetical protein